MSTVGGVVSRLMRDYLSNPGDIPIQTRIATPVNDSQQTIVYADDLTTEEIAAMNVGAVVEMDIEMMRITAHDEDTRTLTVQRGYDLSTPAEHTADTMLRVSPTPTRAMVFEAVADEIVSLFPALYAVGEEWGDPLDNLIEIDASENPVQVLSAEQLLGSEPVSVHATMRHSQLYSTGHAIYYEPRNRTTDVFFRYTRSFSKPASEDEALADLGVDESWERIIMYGVLSAWLISPDVDATTQEFLTESLEAQGFPATTGTDLSVALERLRTNEIRKAQERLVARNNVHVVFQDSYSEL